MPYDIELAEAMRVALKGKRGIVEKKMFGGICWLLKGNMLCGVEVGRYMFRVGKELESAALARAGAKPMDITGKPMRGFVWVDARHAKKAALKHWIAMAQSYVSTLEPK